MLCPFFPPPPLPSDSVLERPLMPLQLQDLLPVFYEDGEQQGRPVILGTGGFGTVELVRTEPGRHGCEGAVGGGGVWLQPLKTVGFPFQPRTSPTCLCCTPNALGTSMQNRVGCVCVYGKPEKLMVLCNKTGRGFSESI